MILEWYHNSWHHPPLVRSSNLFFCHRHLSTGFRITVNCHNLCVSVFISLVFLCFRVYTCLCVSSQAYLILMFPSHVVPINSPLYCVSWDQSVSIHCAVYPSLRGVSLCSCQIVWVLSSLASLWVNIKAFYYLFKYKSAPGFFPAKSPHQYLKFNTDIKPNLRKRQM